MSKLKKIAPNLHKLKNLSSGFKVPKGYFENTEDSIWNSIFLDKINTNSPFSTPSNYFESIETKVYSKIDLKNKNSFPIPKDYFETIEDKVFQKIKKETKIEKFQNTLLRKIIPIGIAASLLIYISLQLFKTKEQDFFANLEISEIENWIDNGNLEIDTYEIATIYEDIDFEDLELENQYSEDDLINYLDDINIESLILIN
ncbi:hypothetical protein [Urechidicola croceus]|uniref:Uncharacterized protein n=1 Tax=Urechidicola croceus TaxID=1850246 RepID=A0A1D8P428_9FLAO|nr:hypothetical protein [Urechidicola croceus]AOW19297.1 hypothetical protein LPB138_00740 [Urechidicola croceus]